MTESDADALADDLRQSVGDLVRTVRQDTGTVRSAQSETLDLLDRFGAMNVAALAERRGVTHQTMRLVVSQLETAGLVCQYADPSDRRSRLFSISAAGRADLRRDQKARTARIADAIRARLSNIEQGQLRTAISILNRLAEPLI